jgi:hypothetical protein
MRVWGTFTAFSMWSSDTERDGITPAGIAGLRHKPRHKRPISGKYVRAPASFFGVMSFYQISIGDFRHPDAAGSVWLTNRIPREPNGYSRYPIRYHPRGLKQSRRKSSPRAVCPYRIVNTGINASREDPPYLAQLWQGACNISALSLST